MTETVLSPAFHLADLDAHGNGVTVKATRPVLTSTEQAAAAVQSTQTREELIPLYIKIPI